tara:strand:+ start:4809 stop:6218 length:1410 start_codon:yes stop_codon:yes gene_type:complete
MPQITFNWYRDAGDSNYITWGPITIGPNTGSGTWNLPNQTTYPVSCSGSGPGQCHLRVLSPQSLGLDDRQGAGADNDWNDMIVNCSSGTWQGTWPNITFVTSNIVYGCTDPKASNYNSNATVNQGCVYLPPTVVLTANKNYTISPNPVMLSWSITGNPGFDSANLSNYGSLTTSGLYSGQTRSGNVMVYPGSTTTYTMTGYAPGSQTAQTSATITAYTPPTVFLTLNTSQIVIGQSATLTWYITGDATNMSISSIGGNLPFSSNTTVTPTTTTTYTATVTLTTPAGDTTNDSKQITLTVIEIPEIAISGGTYITYDDDECKINVQAENCEVVTFVIITNYLNGTSSQQTVSNHSPTNGNYDFNVLPYVSWNDFGPSSVQVVASGTANNGGLSDTDTHTFTVVIDTTPDLVTIPTSDQSDPEEEVISPDITITTESVLIDDIDIPVEVKASEPIKIDINDSGNWQDVRQI